MNVKMLLSLAAVAAMLNATAGVVGDVLKPYVENGQLPGAISIISMRCGNGREGSSYVSIMAPFSSTFVLTCTVTFS